jgi:hypothetical protein
VRKLFALTFAVLVLGACPKGGARPGDMLPGAPAARPAVEGFLRAVKAQDLQAMSTIWGTIDGPVRDSKRLGREELEKRELIMQCYLSHDRYRIGDESPGEGGRRVFRVALTKGNLTRETNFTTIKGPSERWYVEEADINATRDLCAQGKSGTP